MTAETKPDQPWNRILIYGSPNFHEDLVKAGEEARVIQNKNMRSRGKSDKCNSDYQFMGPAAGVNSQRRQETLIRMGIH